MISFWFSVFFFLGAITFTYIVCDNLRRHISDIYDWFLVAVYWTATLLYAFLTFN